MIDLNVEVSLTYDDKLIVKEHDGVLCFINTKKETDYIPKEEWDNLFVCISKAEEVANKLRGEEMTSTIQKVIGRYLVDVRNHGPNNYISIGFKDDQRSIDITGDVNELNNSINAMIDLKSNIQRLV